MVVSTRSRVKSGVTYSGALSSTQREPIVGRESEMVQNNAGGVTFQVTPEQRLLRFLILGSESPTYYQSQKDITKSNAKSILDFVKADGETVVRVTVEVSDSGRAPKNEPALFVLALCSAYGNDATRRAAFDALPSVARTGTHLFTYAGYVDSMRGWGRGLRNAVANWYQSKSVPDLAYQAVKYQARGGWSNADLLRLSHPQTSDLTRNALYKWMVDGVVSTEATTPDLDLIYAFEDAKTSTDAKDIVRLIRDKNLPREAIPTQFLNDNDVWAALLQNMPVTAMIRNLGVMTKNGLISPLSDASKLVVARLGEMDRLRKGRVHPAQILMALRTYEAGHGFRGTNTWTPDSTVCKALEDAFYLAYGAVTPSLEDYFFGLDVSGSMGMGEVAGIPRFTPREATVALTLVSLNVERNTFVGGFTTNFKPLNITARQSIKEATRIVERLPFGATDCAQPMKYALANKIPVDKFVVITDNETWAGDSHPVTELQRYRDKMGRPAKLIVVGLTATDFTIADPKDAGMLDVVGFDTNVPQIISQFGR